MKVPGPEKAANKITDTRIQIYVVYISNELEPLLEVGIWIFWYMM